MVAVLALMLFIGSLIALPALGVKAMTNRPTPPPPGWVIVTAVTVGLIAVLFFMIGCVMTIQFAGGDVAEAERGQKVLLFALASLAAAFTALAKARWRPWATGLAAALLAPSVAIAFLS